jgi:molybdopterin-guanine dinucleotide biosynthesis protein A
MASTTPSSSSPTGRCPPSVAESHDAVVLAGGAARRLGGVDKPALPVGGSSMLDRVLAALPHAARVVVVGPRRPTERDVTWCQERPPGGGPVAGLAAGLAEVTADTVVVLAADLPFLTPSTIDALLAAAHGHDGALLVDDDGRDQLLVGAWRSGPLRAALPLSPAGSRLGELLGRLDVARVAGAPGQPWFDCDTDDDLQAARGRA